MQNQLGTQIEILRKFGLDKEEAEIYLHLLSYGKKTISELRRESRTGSSKALSLINQLKRKNLVKELRLETGRFVQAVDPDILKRKLEEQKQDISMTKNDFNQTIDELQAIAEKYDHHSKILKYSGLDGLKQIMWHSSNAKQTLRLYSIPEMNDVLDFGFYEKIREIYVDNHIVSFELSNQEKQEPWTHISDYVRIWETKYIPSEILHLKFETMIYNDVYALYNKEADGIFCVEIHNSTLANMQKQLFDFIWNRAQKMKVIDPLTGEAVLNTA